MTPYLDVFNHHFRGWVAAACTAWGYGPPGEVFYHRVRERLTDETLGWIGYGVEAGLILENGLEFNLADNAEGKGPYRWFSKRRDATEPQCNWEYYVQVAFFASLWQPCQEAGLRLTFEDELMDLAVRRDDNLLWLIEVKEQAVKLEQLLAKLRSLGVGVDLQTKDRGNDPLRKAKYVVRHRPEFFSGVAIGLRRDFRVSYGAGNAFDLVDGTPPVEPLEEPTPSV